HTAAVRGRFRGGEPAEPAAVAIAPGLARELPRRCRVWRASCRGVAGFGAKLSRRCRIWRQVVAALPDLARQSSPRCRAWRASCRGVTRFRAQAVVLAAEKGAGVRY